MLERVCFLICELQRLAIPVAVLSPFCVFTVSKYENNIGDAERNQAYQENNILINLLRGSQYWFNCITIYQLGFYLVFSTVGKLISRMSAV